MTERIVIGGEVSLETAIDGDLNLASMIDGESGVFMPVYPDSYAGDYVITPTSEAQTLPTDHLVMARNITINPIPSNYGRILYNGSTITVY